MNWTEQELQVVRTLFPTHTAEQLMPHLPNRSPKAIRLKARALKVVKTERPPKNWRPIGSERMDRGYLIRKVTDTGQPKKDWKRVDVINWEAIHGPIPEGMVLAVREPGLQRTLENLALVPHDQQFRRARHPQMMHPIGTERMRHGVMERKISETGDRQADWKRTDTILWESVHGPVPPDKVLMAIDNSKPRTLDNLALFTREEHFRRVSVHNMPPEVAELYTLKTQITKAVKKLARKAESEKSGPT